MTLSQPLHKQVVCTNYVQGNAPLSFNNALVMERGMLDHVGRSLTPPSQNLCVAIWQTEQSIILPSGMSQKHCIDRASRSAQRTGWPVYERHTGGDVTPQFDGVLNISMGFLLGENDCNISTAYERLTAPLISFLKTSFDVDAYLASVKGAFCDGTYNVVVDGKKLAGTAQRWRRLKTDADQPQATAVLGHIALLCGGALGDALKATNLFFDEAGIDRRVDPAVHVSVADLGAQNPNVGPEELATKLTDHINTEMLIVN